MIGKTMKLRVVYLSCLAEFNHSLYLYIDISPLRGWGSLTMASTGKFVYIYIYIYIYVYI